MSSSIAVISEAERVMVAHPALSHCATKVKLASSDVSLFCYDMGQKDADSTMLLVHGLGDDGDTWLFVMEELAKSLPKMRLVAFDLPGFGRSDKPDVSYSMDFYLDTITELLNVLNLDKVHLVGHSLGGILSHEFTLRNPLRVISLTVCGGAMVRVAGSWASTFNTILLAIPFLGEYMYTSLRDDPSKAYASLRSYYFDFDALPEAHRNFLAMRVQQRVWSDGQRTAFLRTIRSLVSWYPAQQASVKARMQACNVATLCVWGEKDAINSVNSIEEIEKFQTPVTVKVVPNAGHNVQQEGAKDMAEALVAHVTTHSTS